MYYRLFRYFFSLVCILFVIGCSKDSQIESFHIKAEVDTTKATIGDIVSLRIIAEESDGLHLSFPDMEDSEFFEIRQKQYLKKGKGVVLRGLVPSRNPIVQMGLEIAGGIGGDIGGMTVADNFMRMRHGGYTPWEQKQLEQQALLENEILAKYLANMQGYTQDPFLVQNGLG